MAQTTKTSGKRKLPRWLTVVAIIIALLGLGAYIYFGSQVYAKSNPISISATDFVTQKSHLGAMNAQVVGFNTDSVTIKVSPWEYYTIMADEQTDIGDMQLGETIWWRSWLDDDFNKIASVGTQPGSLLFLPADPEYHATGFQMCFVPGMKKQNNAPMSWSAASALENRYLRGTWRDACGSAIIELDNESGGWFFADDQFNLYHWNEGELQEDHMVDGYAHFESIEGGNYLFIFDQPRDRSQDQVAIERAEQVFTELNLAEDDIWGEPNGVIQACWLLSSKAALSGMTEAEVQELCLDGFGTFDYEQSHQTLTFLYSDNHMAVVNRLLDERANATSRMQFDQVYDYVDLQLTLTNQTCKESDWALGEFSGYELAVNYLYYGDPQSYSLCVPHGAYLTVDEHYEFTFADEGADEYAYYGDYAETYRVP